MREIVTLQLGHLSNYVATHYWNVQESYFTYSAQDESPVDHDIHWRPGVDASGAETFLPRTVIYDLKGGFGSLRKINAMYDPAPDENDAASASLWRGQSIVHKQQPIEQSSYQQSLDSGTNPPKLSSSAVRYWSDFSRVFFHPRSLVQLYDYELNSSIRPFERFSMGLELFDTLDKDEDVVDRDFRPFVEECDRMDGIQTMATIDDAWGGFAAKYLEALQDEYPKACSWLWGLQSPLIDAPREKRALCTSNVAQTLALSCSSASMTIPLSLPEARLPPQFNLNPKSPWQVSAAFATAIETATLQSRLTAKAGGHVTSLWGMTEILNPGDNQKLARMRLRVGSSSNANELDSDDYGERVDLFGIGFSRDSRAPFRRGQIFSQLISRRGTYPADGNEETDSDKALRHRIIGDPICSRLDSPLAFPMLDSFPSIYRELTDSAHVDAETVLSVDHGIAPRVLSLKAQAARTVGIEERETLSNALDELADAYRNDWSSGSDDNDDDM